MHPAWGQGGAALGKLRSLTYPSHARLVYSYDAQSGRLSGISLNPVKADGSGTDTGRSIALLTNIDYTALGQIKAWNWGTGVNYGRNFDEHSRLKSYPLGNPLGGPQAAGLIRTLDYDDAGRIRAYTHHDGGGQAKPAFDQGFDYDGLDRLTDQNLAATTYDYRNDDAGNLKSDGTNSFNYSDRGRLASVVTPGGQVSYLYNALEQRVVKTGPAALVAGGANYYVYDEQDRLIGEYDAQGNPLQETVYLGDTPVAVIQQTRTGSGAGLSVNTQLSDVYADHIDTPRVIVRQSDHAAVWRWDQAEAYGNAAPHQNPTGLGTFVYNPRFPGQLHDPESNLSYNLHRSYRPPSGSYSQSDPIGLEGGINMYAYANGNPVSYVDPDGRLAWWVIPAGLLVYKVGSEAWKFYKLQDCIKGCPVECDDKGDTRANLKCKHDCLLSSGRIPGSPGPRWPTSK